MLINSYALLSIFVLDSVWLAVSNPQVPPADGILRWTYSASKSHLVPMSEQHGAAWIPAWIDSQRRLMTPSNSVYSPGAQDLGSPSYSSYSSYSSYEAVIMGPDSSIPSLSNSFVPSPSPSYPQYTHGIMTPSLTYADGSDIFTNDLFQPWLDPDYSDNSSLPVSPGCFFKELGYLVCNDDTMTTVPSIPAELIVFQMNNTMLRYLTADNFNGLKVAILKLDFNQLNHVGPAVFAGTVGLQELSLENNRIESSPMPALTGLDSLIVLSLKGNRINLSAHGYHDYSDDDLLPSLVYLNMANNPLGSLNQFVFSRLNSSPVEELNLQSCNLSYIHPGMHFFLYHSVTSPSAP